MNNKRPLTRDQLSQLSKDHQVIKAFEKILDDVNTNIPIDINNINVGIQSANVLADTAYFQANSNSDELSILSGESANYIGALENSSVALDTSLSLNNEVTRLAAIPECYDYILNSQAVTSVTGTTNQINVNQSVGDVVLSLPQDFNIGAAPILAGTNFSSIPESAVTNLISDLSSKLPLAGGTMTGFLFLNANPTDVNHAANKGYVDSFVQGIPIKTPVRVATTANLNVSYNNGTSGVGAFITNTGSFSAWVIEGVTLAINDRILVKNQTNQLINGVYSVTNTGSPSTAYIAVRATDYDSSSEVVSGSGFYVNEGTQNAGILYVMTTIGTVTIGTTNITFTDFTSAASLTAGTGLQRVGNQFSIDSSVVTLTGSQTLTNKSIDSGQLTGTISASRFPALTGDVTSSVGSVSTTLTANIVSNAKFRQSVALSVVGNSTNGTANVADLSASADGNVLRRSGTSLGFGSIALGSSNAVSGVLPPINGGNGSSTIFTAGSVVFSGASGVYTQDNANFFWDATNARLLIKTSTAPTVSSAITSSVGTANQANLTLAGNSFDGTSTTDGISFAMVHNASGNRQLAIGDSTKMSSSSSNVVIRLIPGSTATIDAVATDGSTVKQLNIGNSGNVCLLGLIGFGSSSFTPINRGDFNGGVAIGSYAGNNTAPSNGLIVSGDVYVGTPSASGGKFYVSGGGTKTGSDGAPIASLATTDATPVALSFGIIASATSASQGIYLQATEPGVTDNHTLTLQRFGGVLGVGTVSVTSGYIAEFNGAIKSTKILDGTYTPTLTSIISINAGGSTVDTHNYIRVENTVTVTGNIICAASATTNSFAFRISLPIASALTSASQAQGSGNSYDITTPSNTSTVFISAETTNDQVQFSVSRFGTNITSGNTFRVMYTFQYRVL